MIGERLVHPPRWLIASNSTASSDDEERREVWYVFDTIVRTKLGLSPKISIYETQGDIERDCSFPGWIFARVQCRCKLTSTIPCVDRRTWLLFGASSSHTTQPLAVAHLEHLSTSYGDNCCAHPAAYESSFELVPQ